MIDIITWQEVMNNCSYDEAVGIKIAKIADGDNYSTFITSIDPHKNVKPHYHKHGNEHYHIISGNGNIQLENVNTGEKSSHSVSAGQSFTVAENILHQLINTSSNAPLVLMFSCPPSHLDADRYFI